MSKREAVESLPGELLIRQRGLLRSGRVKNGMSMSNSEIGTAMTTASGERQNVAKISVAEHVEVRPEVTENIAKQVVRMSIDYLCRWHACMND